MGVGRRHIRPGLRPRSDVDPTSGCAIFVRSDVHRSVRAGVAARVRTAAVAARGAAWLLPAFAGLVMLVLLPPLSRLEVLLLLRPLLLICVQS